MLVVSVLLQHKPYHRPAGCGPLQATRPSTEAGSLRSRLSSGVHQSASPDLRCLLSCMYRGYIRRIRFLIQIMQNSMAQSVCCVVSFRI